LDLIGFNLHARAQQQVTSDSFFELLERQDRERENEREQNERFFGDEK